MFPWSIALSLSSIADAANATGRLYGVFEAEVLEKTHTVDPSLDVAIEVKGASFAWDSLSPDAVKCNPEKKGTHDVDEKAKTEEERVFKFKVRDVNMSVPKGQLVAIIGPLGSGKTSLLQGLIGEMRKTQGSIVFGGSVGYCSQSAWIQVCSIFRCGWLGLPSEQPFA
jgi:ABC-type transport system involved in cytochrome bd biosynthesis fused ATPase/permease subunit